jgi:Protein of unknown function DUF45
LLWFNLELAKKPVSCLEHILMHELIYLLAHNLTDWFTSVMDELILLPRLLLTMKHKCTAFYVALGATAMTELAAHREPYQ